MYLSVDPYMRAYAPRLKLGSVFIGRQVARYDVVIVIQKVLNLNLTEYLKAKILNFLLENMLLENSDGEPTL